MGTRLARTVADHALHVRLLVLNDYFTIANLRGIGTPACVFSTIRSTACWMGRSADPRVPLRKVLHWRNPGGPFWDAFFPLLCAALVHRRAFLCRTLRSHFGSGKTPISMCICKTCYTRGTCPARASRRGFGQGHSGVCAGAAKEKEKRGFWGAWGMGYGGWRIFARPERGAGGGIGRVGSGPRAKRAKTGKGGVLVICYLLYY